MVADCLTKRVRSDRLSECLRSCWLDLITTDESVLCNMKKQKWRTNPDGNAGGMDRNDHFGQWRSHTERAPCGMKSLRSDTLTMRVTGVKITVFSSAIVMSLSTVIPQGPFESNGREQLSLFSCGWGFDPFRPVEHREQHLTSQARNSRMTEPYRDYNVQMESLCRAHETTRRPVSRR